MLIHMIRQLIFCFMLILAIGGFGCATGYVVDQNGRDTDLQDLRNDALEKQMETHDNR